MMNGATAQLMWSSHKSRSRAIRSRSGISEWVRALSMKNGMSVTPQAQRRICVYCCTRLRG